MKSIELLVLAGGAGTRLRSAVAEVPKPLAPVLGRPYLWYLLESWRAQGVDKMTFLLHYQADLIRAFLTTQQDDGLLKGCEIHVVAEPAPLGTGGAVAYAVSERRPTGSFLVANADTWLGTGIASMAAAQWPAIASVHVEDPGRYGQLMSVEGKVVSFEEKQSGAGPGRINAGLYHLHAKYFSDWRGEPFSLERNLFPKLVDAGELKDVALATDFIDIGIPEDYFRFCRWIESGKIGAP